MGRLTIAVLAAALAQGCGARSDIEQPLPECPQHFADCDGDGTRETDLWTSSESCGRCDEACAEDLFCGAGRCRPGQDIVQIELGAFHSCALRASGEVLCWGLNAKGQLGLGSSDYYVPTPQPVVGLSDAVHLSAGGHRACALQRSGTVMCWGGMLSDQPAQIVPARAGLVPDAARVAAAVFSTCVLRKNCRVACWGDNRAGQLGSGTFESSESPADVVYLDDAVQFSAGGSSLCATRPGGGLVCWGRNRYGQLGDHSGVDRPAPAPVTGISEVRTVKPGGLHTCALRGSGEMWCWGWNQGWPYEPRLEDLLPRDGVAIAVGAVGDHHCMVRANGGVACTGEWAGDIGEDYQVRGLNDAVPLRAGSIDAGSEHTCVLRATGQVACWGMNDYGQLGDGTTVGTGSPVTVVGLP